MLNILCYIVNFQPRYAYKLQPCIKNHTHVKKVGHTSEFLFGIYWWTWKTTIYLRNCWSRPIKNVSIFLPFYPPNNPENQNFEKLKKASGDVIILHMCTKNDDHIIYASWDMECDRNKFLSFWASFCSFTPLLAPKIKVWKKYKKHSEILSFFKCVP